MTTDYDAPRRAVIDDDDEDALSELRQRGPELQLGVAGRRSVS